MEQHVNSLTEKKYFMGKLEYMRDIKKFKICAAKTCIDPCK